MVPASHAGCRQSTRLIALRSPSLYKSYRHGVENQRDHLVQAFIELHFGRPFFGQSAHGLHAALSVQYILRIMTLSTSTSMVQAFAGGVCSQCRAIGYGILERDHDGSHLSGGRRGGNADLNFVRCEIGNTSPVTDDSIDPHEYDEHHHEVSCHAIAGKPGDHRVHPEVALVFFGTFPLPLVLPLPLPLGGGPGRGSPDS